jgi:HlyD family secretion protein
MNMPGARPDGTAEEFLGLPPAAKGPRLKRWGLAAAGLAVLLFVVSRFTGSDASGPRYATVELKRGEMTVHVTATGNLEPTNEVSVGSELSGLIDTVLVDINDRVTKGQRLAQIDTEKLNDAIRRSEAALDQAKAGVLQADATLDLTRASLARLEEAHRLSGGKVPALAELDTSRAEAKRAVANLASARASVSSAEAQLSTDRTNLSKATIRSPVDGVILSRTIEPGQTIAASFNAPQLFVIAEDLAAMKLEVKVDEADVGQVRVGQPTTFTVDAYPGKTFEAVITRVNVGSNRSDTTGGSGTAAAAATASEVVSYGAVLSVRNEDLALRPGMTATASILTSDEQDVLMVPNPALRFRPRSEPEGKQGFTMFPRTRPERAGQQVGLGRGANQNIYVLGKDGEVSEIPVLVGNTDGAWTIVSGKDLAPGMAVITGELAPRP